MDYNIDKTDKRKVCIAYLAWICLTKVQTTCSEKKSQTVVLSVFSLSSFVFHTCMLSVHAFS